MMASSSSKKKVLLIGYGLYGGGAEANAIHISDYLYKKGVETDFFLFKRVNDYENVYRNKLKSVRIISALPNKKLQPKEYLKGFFRILTTLFSTISTKKYNVLASMVEYIPAYLTVIMGICFRKKTILFIGENIHEDLKQKPVLNRFFHLVCMRFSFRFSSKIVCVSHGLANSIQTQFHVPPSKIATIYNGVDIPFIQKLSKKKIYKRDHVFIKGTNTVCILGRLERKKGHNILLSALNEIHSFLPIRLIIIGTGKLEKEIRNYVVRHHLSPIVLLVGFSPNPYSYISQSDLFVLCSRYEGFGNVVVEAMATQAPVLVSDCDFGPREIVGPRKMDGLGKHIEEHIYGLLFQMKKKTSQEQIVCLKKALIAYFQNKNKYKKIYSTRGMKRAKEFTHERMCHSYYELIMKVIAL